MTAKISETLQKLQSTELEILSAIQKVCENNDITWWLDSGTALGAMRHQGFIPWDDDIDIGMLREDYDKFCSIAPLELPKGFSFHNARTEEGFAPLFSKVWKDGTKFYTHETIDSHCNQGIFVDVFPYDYIDTSREGLKRKKRMIRAQRLSYLYHSYHIKVPGKGIVGVIEKAACVVFHVLVKSFLSKKFIINMFDEACRTIKSSNMVISSAYAYGDPLPVEWMVPTIDLQFENMTVPCPGEIEKYLENRYGNWRKLPPENQRTTHLPLVVEF